jgi:hypothetical protein
MDGGIEQNPAYGTARTYDLQDLVLYLRFCRPVDPLAPQTVSDEGHGLSTWSEADNNEFDRIVAEVVAEEQRRDLEARLDEDPIEERADGEDSADISRMKSIRD